MNQNIPVKNTLQPGIKDWIQASQQEIEQALMRWVAPGSPPDLEATMRYAVLDGGKRLRPMLVLAAHEALLAQAAQLESAESALWRNAALRAACAVELIHAYSLVHDDMPCMDNDVLRRGKPTTHVQFGEATALLAGDAMQALAFELLTPMEPVVVQTLLPAATQARLCGLLAKAAGGAGMAGGQAIDLAHVGRSMSQDELQTMHRLKTGMLLQASVDMGAQCIPVDVVSACLPAFAALHEYGNSIGLAFQVIDDVLDATAESALLGKTAGKDAANEKPTFVSLMGIERATAYAQELHQQAIQALNQSGLTNIAILEGLADMVINRKY